MGTIVNYAKRWKFELSGDKCVVKGDYQLEGQLMFANTDEIDDIRTGTENRTEIVTVNDWRFLLCWNDEAKSVQVICDDTGREDEAPTEQTVVSLCEKYNINFRRINLEDMIVTYASRASDNDMQVATDIAMFAPNISSILVIAAESGNIKVKDVAGNEHKLFQLIVPMVSNTVFDIKHGYLGINVYEYMEMLYGVNDEELHLVEGPTSINELVANHFSDTEWNFWDCLMKPELYSYGAQNLKIVVDAIKAQN